MNLIPVGTGNGGVQEMSRRNDQPDMGNNSDESIVETLHAGVDAKECNAQLYGDTKTEKQAKQREWLEGAIWAAYANTLRQDNGHFDQLVKR